LLDASRLRKTGLNDVADERRPSLGIELFASSTRQASLLCRFHSCDFLRVLCDSLLIDDNELFPYDGKAILPCP
jgi:hypothetical protein